MKRLLVHYSIAALVAYTGLCGWLYFAQDKLLYLPTAEVRAENADIVALQNGDATLKVWKVGAGSKAVLYFGGNGEDVANNIERFRDLLPDTSFYLMNYRGYGGSSGEPTESAIFADAASLYDLARKDHQQIAVIGRSLGSGVATWLAANREISKLVLVTPFDSLEAVASGEYPFAPVSLLLRDKYRSIDYVPRIRAPVLVLLADTDNVVPHHHAMNLVGQFPIEQVSVRILLGSTHNSISSAADYLILIKAFLLNDSSQEPDAAAAVAHTL
ncbi:MAG: alpha/beta hydrolase [Woeseia sp.]